MMSFDFEHSYQLGEAKLHGDEHLWLHALTGLVDDGDLERPPRRAALRHEARLVLHLPVQRAAERRQHDLRVREDVLHARAAKLIPR